MDRKSAIFFMEILPLFLILVAVPVNALERMSAAEMGQVTAQGGISMALDGLVVTDETTGFSLKDVGTRDSSGNLLSDDGYFKADLFSLFTADTGFDIDLGSIHGNGTLIFDGASPGIAGINIDQVFGEISLDFEINDIRVWNHSLDVPAETPMGSLSVANFSIFETTIKLFTSIDGTCGIRGLSESQWSVDSVDFFNEQGALNLNVSGMMMGQTITGDLPDDNLGTAPIDTDAWAFDGDGFRIGIPLYAADYTAGSPFDTTLPFSIDISSAPRQGADGETITTPYILVNAPMEGSMRMKSVASANFDMGPIAIDGIRLYKNIIEFPGRGIGN